MNATQLPDDFVESLLAQDSFFASSELAEHRRRVIDRLTEARKKEKRARKFVLIAWGAAIAIVGAVFAGAAYEVTQSSVWPDWVTMVLALVVLLSPLTALLLLGLYLFRYRWELVRARKAAREQALSEIPRQLKELRQELDRLRKQTDRKSTRLNSSHIPLSRMPSS